MPQFKFYLNFTTFSLGSCLPLAPCDLQRVLDHLIEPHQFLGGGIDSTAEGLDTSDNCGAALTRFEDTACVFPELIGKLFILMKQLGLADDARQHIVEVMGDSSGHLPKSPKLFRLMQLLPKLILGPLPAFGNITADTVTADRDSTP